MQCIHNGLFQRNGLCGSLAEMQHLRLNMNNRLKHNLKQINNINLTVVFTKDTKSNQIIHTVI